MYSYVKICLFQVESWKWLSPSKSGIIENKLIVLTLKPAGVQSINALQQTNFFVRNNNASAIKILPPVLWWYTFKQNMDSTSFVRSPESSTKGKSCLWHVCVTVLQNQKKSPTQVCSSLCYLFKLVQTSTGIFCVRQKSEEWKLYLRELSVW